MPPVLDPKASKVDGLAFLGLSLTRKGERGHPGSATHQQAFDLDMVQDRDYEYLFSTNDDGWLVGGGEPGPPTSYKLTARDSAHVEIMRVGTYREEWGGLPEELIVETLRKGEILIPEITAVPTAVVANGDKPPELEIRFDMIPEVPNFDDLSAPLPINWQLRFLQNQLFHKFQFASRFTPGAFHSTILRKAEFRSEEARAAYFEKCKAVCEKWMSRGAKPLVPPPGGVSSQIEVVQCVRREPKKLNDDDESRSGRDDHEMQDYYQSGLWLFVDRNNISHQFLPNFLPPYDTPIKKKLILEVLKEQWDEKTLTWKSLTNRFGPLPDFLMPRAAEGPKQKMTALAPKETKRQVPRDKNRLGILDPNDETSFTHFVSNLSTEMANMTAEVCAPMITRDDDAPDKQDSLAIETSDSGVTSPPRAFQEEKSPKDDYSVDQDGGLSGEELLARMDRNRAKAVVTGQRVSKSPRKKVGY